MHSYDSPTSGISYHHHGDYSGDVVVTDLDRAISSTYGYPRVEIPFEDMRSVVFNYLRSQKIQQVEAAMYNPGKVTNALESMTDDEMEAALLSGLPGTESI